jgi:hypothetical protein
MEWVLAWSMTVLVSLAPWFPAMARPSFGNRQVMQ